MQDRTGDYDLRFGLTFYDFSWFEGFDTEEILKNIQLPTIVMHVAPNEITAPDITIKWSFACCNGRKRCSKSC